MNSIGIKNTVNKTLKLLGIIKLGLKYQNKNTTIILMGHRVDEKSIGLFGAISTDEFEKLLLSLLKYTQIISIDEAIKENQSKSKKKRVVITLDDGFKDNYTNAFQILKKHNVQATIYLTYDCIKNRELPWPQRIGAILENSMKENVEINIGESKFIYRQSQLVKLHQIIFDFLIDKSKEDRTRYLSYLKEVLNSNLTEGNMLTVSEISEMYESGLVTFGAHTESHPWCAKIDINEAKKEIANSKTKLETLLNIPIEHFAFPGGSINNQLLNEVINSGYKSCYDDRLGKDGNIFNKYNANPFALVRIGIHNENALLTIAECSGIYTIFRKLIYKLRK
jgi:peptidoglycan/xylan/chitin deacetylase (PgdA/CDA1 family)